jgi:hypothetical protein
MTTLSPASVHAIEQVMLVNSDICELYEKRGVSRDDLREVFRLAEEASAPIKIVAKIDGDSVCQCTHPRSEHGEESENCYGKASSVSFCNCKKFELRTEYTPGPWTTGPRLHADMFLSIMGADGQLIVNMGDGGNGIARQTANGRLISAAPEMYGALKAVERWIVDVGIPFPEAVVRKAIARYEKTA